MAVDWSSLIGRLLSEETAVAVAIALLLLGIVVAYKVWQWVHALARKTGIEGVVEGTPSDRSLRKYGTSTVGLVATLAALVTYVGFMLVALQIGRLIKFEVFWTKVSAFFPSILIAVVAVIVGLVVGERGKIAVSERLRSVKLPEVAIIPEIVKYSIYYIAALIALSQLGIATQALVVLLGAYAFGVVFLGGIAFKDLLSASAAGIYLLLAEPYVIGDEVRIDEKRGIVQEIDMFVTRIESDGEEFIIPNQQVIRSGIVRLRD
ncbi:MAG: mechanosensitive ion channel domain-containing protein [Halovenus sp.]